MFIYLCVRSEHCASPISLWLLSWVLVSAVWAPHSMVTLWRSEGLDQPATVWTISPIHLIKKKKKKKKVILLVNQDQVSFPHSIIFSLEAKAFIAFWVLFKFWCFSTGNELKLSTHISLHRYPSITSNYSWIIISYDSCSTWQKLPHPLSPQSHLVSWPRLFHFHQQFKKSQIRKKFTSYLVQVICRQILYHVKNNFLFSLDSNCQRFSGI